MRSALLLGFALAACEGSGQATAIECRMDGTFVRVCTVEEHDDGELVLKKPDGGFRRLLVTTDGIAAADGAERARVTALADGRLEVEIGGDAFRLPAGTDMR